MVPTTTTRDTFTTVKLTPPPGGLQVGDDSSGGSFFDLVSRDESKQPLPRDEVGSGEDNSHSEDVGVQRENETMPSSDHQRLDRNGESRSGSPAEAARELEGTAEEAQFGTMQGRNENYNVDDVESGTLSRPGSDGTDNVRDESVGGFIRSSTLFSEEEKDEQASSTCHSQQKGSDVVVASDTRCGGTFVSQAEMSVAAGGRPSSRRGLLGRKKKVGPSRARAVLGFGRSDEFSHIADASVVEEC